MLGFDLGSDRGEKRSEMFSFHAFYLESKYKYLTDSKFNTKYSIDY